MLTWKLNQIDWNVIWKVVCMQTISSYRSMLKIKLKKKCRINIPGANRAHRRIPIVAVNLWLFESEKFIHVGANEIRFRTATKCEKKWMIEWLKWTRAAWFKFHMNNECWVKGSKHIQHRRTEWCGSKTAWPSNRKDASYGRLNLLLFFLSSYLI